MWQIVLGSFGFLLYFIYDINSIRKKNVIFQKFFAVGTVFVVVSLLMELLLLWGQCQHRIGRMIGFGTGAVGFFALLIYTLFFALPFDSTYCQEADGHKVCRSGVYGWCRHPGIWWFFGCFFSLGLGTGEFDGVLCGLILSFLNLMYAWYQDRIIFPREFLDYGEYRKEVPFLLPIRGQKR